MGYFNLDHLRLITNKLHGESFCFQCSSVKLARKTFLQLILKNIYIGYL